MTIFGSAVAPLCAAAFVLAAAAAPPVPTPAPTIPAAAHDESDPAALRLWYKQGRCLVDQEGRLAEKILATAPDSDDYLFAWLKAEKAARCFDDPVTAPAKLHSNAMRGAIAEALLLRDFSAVGVRRGKRIAAVFAEDAVPGDRVDVRWRAFLKLAECAVRLEPARSFALFSTPVAGPEERAAVRALVPALGDCLPPGVDLPMRPSMLRSFLAEAAYRVSVAPPPVPRS
jgi:hypothetical protein